MVWELIVGVGLASIVLVFRGKIDGWLGDLVQRDCGVLRISIVVKFDMRDLLVAHNGGVVCDDVTW